MCRARFWFEVYLLGDSQVLIVVVEILALSLSFSLSLSFISPQTCFESYLSSCEHTHLTDVCGQLKEMLAGLTLRLIFMVSASWLAMWILVGNTL